MSAYGDCGAIMAGVARDMRSSRYVEEGIAAARLLRHNTHETKLPLTLFSNTCFRQLVLQRGASALWDEHRELRLQAELRPLVTAQSSCCVKEACSANKISPLVYAYALKLSALLSSRYDRTLFIDLDILVLSPSLPWTLFDILSVVDVAMPGPVPGRHSNLGSATATTLGVPVLCSCLMAYRTSPQVLSWMLDAARRLLTRESPALRRQGDQEYLWLAWVHAHTKLRVLGLPDEYYCPHAAFATLQLERSATPLSPRNLIANVTQNGYTRPCLSVHGHGKGSLIDTALGPFTPARRTLRGEESVRNVSW